MIRDIVKYGDPRLLAPNETVTHFDDDLRRLIADLVETCHAAPGLGLAAPQIGINRRVAIVDLSLGKDLASVIVLVNPQIVEQEGELQQEEGCLSIPDLAELLWRPLRVRVRAQNECGELREVEATELLARALCHETDHLNSKLFIHRLRGLKGEMVRKKVERMARRGLW